MIKISFESASIALIRRQRLRSAQHAEQHHQQDAFPCVDEEAAHGSGLEKVQDHQHEAQRQAREEEAGGGHGSDPRSRLRDHLDASLCGQLRVALHGDDAEHAFSDAVRELVGPFVDGLIGHTQSRGSRTFGAAEELNGFGLEHV